MSYTLQAGEWICPISELQEAFRFRFHHQVISVLQFLEEQHYNSWIQLSLPERQWILFLPDYQSP